TSRLSATLDQDDPPRCEGDRHTRALLRATRFAPKEPMLADLAFVADAETGSLLHRPCAWARPLENIGVHYRRSRGTAQSGCRPRSLPQPAAGRPETSRSGGGTLPAFRYDPEIPPH